MNQAKKVIKDYSIWLIIFIIVAGLAILLKKVFMVKDFIPDTSPVLVIAPLLFIIAMLLAYGLYDKILRPIKKKEQATEQEQWQAFARANKTKAILLSVGGIIISITLVLIWKADYLYLLGIALILFLIALPNKTKFDIEFSKFDKKEQSSDEQNTQEISDQESE